MSAVYELPFGHGRRFLSGAGPLLDTLLGGWTMNSIVTLQGGFPFTPQLSYNPSNNGDTRNPVRPFVNPAFHGPGDSGQSQSMVQSGRISGAAERQRILREPGARHADRPGPGHLGFVVPEGHAPIAERANLQFRAELFNILNRANFNTPNAVVFTPTGVSPTAGVITSTSTTSRQVQFGLKLRW